MVPAQCRVREFQYSHSQKFMLRPIKYVCNLHICPLGWSWQTFVKISRCHKVWGAKDFVTILTEHLMFNETYVQRRFMDICVHRQLRQKTFRACTNFVFVRSVPKNQYYIPTNRLQPSSIITHVCNSGDPKIKFSRGKYLQQWKFTLFYSVIQENFLNITLN
jgi:hypothetical protein